MRGIVYINGDYSVKYINISLPMSEFIPDGADWRV